MRQGTKPGYISVLDPHVEVNGRRVLKIGYTTNTVRKRMQQLSTGAVGDFRIIYQQYVADAPVIEKRVHLALRHARVNREFFAVTPDEAKREIQRAGPTAIMREADLRWSVAMRKFRDCIGATAAEKRVEAASLKTTWWTLALWVTACIFAMFSGRIEALFALPLGLFVAGLAAHLVHKHLRTKLVDRPFRDQIAAERDRLNVRFPESFAATWKQSRRVG